MTQQTDIQAQPTAQQPVPTLDQVDTSDPDAPLLVEPTEDTRLGSLHAQYADAKAAVEAATEKLKEITDGIKFELAQAAPQGTKKLELRGAGCPTLRLTHSESWRVDSKKLKAEDPITYVRYAKKSESWTLTQVKGGDS